MRRTLPSDCLTAFFDPIKNECTCSNDDCKFEDQTRPIGNYSTNLGGTGAGASGSGTATQAEVTAPSKQNSGAAGGGAWSVAAGAAALVAALAA